MSLNRAGEEETTTGLKCLNNNNLIVQHKFTMRILITKDPSPVVNTGNPPFYPSMVINSICRRQYSQLTQLDFSQLIPLNSIWHRTMLLEVERKSNTQWRRATHTTVTSPRCNLSRQMVKTSLDYWSRPLPTSHLWCRAAPRLCLRLTAPARMISTRAPLNNLTTSLQ